MEVDMATTKYSRQRESIVNFLKTRKDHPTADVIYQNLRLENPTLSLGTVYRNLTKLSDSGVILKISCNDASDHFDGDIHPHGHFMCNCCHQITDLSTQTLNIQSVIDENSFCGEISETQVLFYGTCERCLKN
jgi:Fur family peroxide stress response transcriptional regulator